eukprot:Pgem_evm1s7015
MELNPEGYLCQLSHLDWHFKLFNQHLDTLFFFEQNKGSKKISIQMMVLKFKNTNLDASVDKNTLLDSIPSSDFTSRHQS